jgi:hypothetical protein
MCTSLEMLSPIPWSKFPVAKDFVSLGLRFRRELPIDRAAVDKKRCFRYCSIFLFHTNVVEKKKKGGKDHIIPRDLRGTLIKMGAKRYRLE